MDYAKVAKEIYTLAGERENLVSAAHCATRLRLVIVDNGKCDAKAIEEVDGVKGVFFASGQLQVILGTGTVNKVYDEFLTVSGMSAATKDDVKAAAAAQQNILKRAVKAIGDVFVPILPAIVATGLMMGLVEALAKAIPSFAGSDWFAVLDMIANTAFAYLPVLVAVSAARVFGGNIFLGAVIGLLMIHSNLINAWAVSGYEGEIPVWHLIGNVITIRQVGYQGHVIPVVIAVLLMSKLEGWLHKHVPEVIDLFVTPLITVLITSFATLIVIGPVFAAVENYVLGAAESLIAVPYGIGAFVMGAIYPLTVVCGLHHMYNVIELGMLSNVGLNTWMPVASAANFAQCAACLAVAVKCKKAKTKTIAIPSALSAALGITEPAIFGVNLRFMKPLIAGMAGGAVGAAFGAIMGVGATANGVTGIPGFLITTNCTLQYALMLLISFAVSFAVCWMIWHEEEEQRNESAGKTERKSGENISGISCEPNTVYAPMDGQVIRREEISDSTFAAGVLGDGAGIIPSGNAVYAPFDGAVNSIFDTKHAVGLTSDDGLELLIHVGINTVELGGKYYESFVNEGDTVRAGQLLLQFDRDKIKAAGYDITTAVLVCNSDEFEQLNLEKTGEIKALDKLISVK